MSWIMSRDDGAGGGVVVREGREAPKTLNSCFCLCASKEILALTGVFFLPGMEQK